MPRCPQIRPFIEVLCKSVLVCLVAIHSCPLYGQDAAVTQQTPTYPAVTLKSPYRSLAKTRQLLDT